MEWYFLLLIGVGGLLVYLGIGNAVMHLLYSADKKVSGGKEHVGPYSRGMTWLITLCWPFIVVAALIFIGLAVLLAAFIIAIILSLVAIVLAVVGVLIGVVFTLVVTVLAVGGVLLGLVFAILGGVLALAVVLFITIVMATIILSPILGIETLKNIARKFNPVPFGLPKTADK